MASILTSEQQEVILHINTNYAETINEIQKLTKDLALLKVEMSKVQQQQKNGEITTEEANKQLEALEAEYRSTQKTIRTHKKELENAAGVYKENEGSIKQMRLELSNMRKEYESLSKADRESDKGKTMLDNIAKTTEELKELEYQQLDFRRNVGNYSDALRDLDPKLAKALEGFKRLSGGTMNLGTAFKNAIPMIKSFGKQLLKLAVNPVVLAIIAVITVVKQLVEQFKRTDDAMTALQQLFASLSPIIEVFTALLDVTVKVLTKVIGGVTKAVTALMSLVPAFGEASKAAQEYVLTLDDLEERERKYAVETAKNNVEIARARNKAAQADIYSVEERRDAIQKAIDLEKRNLQMELDVAETRLRLAQQDAARRRDTSDETKNNIAQLEAAYYQAIANTEAGMRRLHSQMAKFNAEIRKDTIQTWKTIIGNSAFSTADWKKADAEYKKKVDTMEKRASELARAAAEAAAAGYDNTALLEASKQASKEAEEYRNDQKTEHKKYLDALKNLSEQYYSNELSARRAYEDAVLEMMDETLEKQLKAIETQYNREIEDLRHRLKTEEHLTVEAREAINKLIIEKQKQLNKQRTLTEAAYWSDVREQARETMNQIAAMNQQLAGADPNRYIGSFAASVANEMRGVTDELETTSNMLLEKFQGQYAALATVIRRILAEGGEGLSENVKKMFTAIVNETDEFSNNAVKSLDSFMLAFEAMQQRIQLKPEEFVEMREAIKPMLDNILDYYKHLADMPSRYMEYMSNLLFNKMDAEAGKIREHILKTLDFQPFTEKKIEAFGKELDRVDAILASKTDAWQYRLDNGIGFKIEDPYKIKGAFEFESPKLEVDELIGEAQDEADKNKIELNWEIATDDPELEKKFHELGEKYGNEIDTSMSGVLKQISGFDDLEGQLNWLVRNYETAVRRINEMADEMRDAYQFSGDDAFYMAIPDTGTILSALRRIYDSFYDYSQQGYDYDKARLEIEQKYVNEADGELKTQIELTNLNKRRYEEQEKTSKAQLEYVRNIRTEVADLKGEYNKINQENSSQISVLETQLQILHDERATLAAEMENATTDEERANVQLKIDTNNINTDQIQAQIKVLREQIEKALAELVATGFTSVNQVDETIRKLEKDVLEAQNGIIQSTAQQTENYTQLWLQSFQRVTGGLGQIGSAFNSMFSEMGEISDKWNAFAEATAYFTIGINMAEGIAEAVAAGSGVPWPANLAAIASGISAVIAGIASALSTYRQYHKPNSNFATGGLIGGRYARSRAEGRRDDVPINASKGEYIINADAVKKYGVDFLDLLNFGKQIKVKRPKFHFADGGYVSDTTIKTANSQMNMEATKDMLMEVMSEISPVVSVVEVTKAQNKVRIKENIAKK